MFDADSEQGRYLRLDTLPIPNPDAEQTIVRLPAENLINRENLERLIDHLEQERCGGVRPPEPNPMCRHRVRGFSGSHARFVVIASNPNESSLVTSSASSPRLPVVEVPMSADTKIARPRRRFGLRLRGLMVVVLVIGLGLGWAKHKIRTQREAVEAVEREGGFITFDYAVGDLTSTRQPPGPEWLRKFIGDELFQEVAEVDFAWIAHVPERPVDEATLVRLESFPELRELHVGRTVTGDVCRHIRGLTNLEILDLEGTPIYDQGLANLSGLTHLTRLNLGNTGITADGMRHIRGLTRLERLDLHSTAINDASLANLTGLTELRYLNINLDLTVYDPEMPAISDAGLHHLAVLTKLEELYLDSANVSDAGLAHLSGLKELKRLDLRGTKVTDVGMTTLSSLSKLILLDLSHTAVGVQGILRLKPLVNLREVRVSRATTSGPGMAGLKKALPNLDVIYRDY